MNLTDLLADIDARGIALRVDGDELVVDAPDAAIDDTLLQRLRAGKGALLDWCRRRDGGVRTPGAAECAAIAARLGVDVERILAIHALSPLQEGLLLEHRLGASGDPYLVRMELAFASRATLDRFLAVFEAVLNRHDALRSAFDWESLAEPVQVVLRDVRLPLVEHANPAGGDAAALLRARTDPRERRLDLRRAPLFEAAIAANDADRWQLALLFHHIVCDHLSLDVVIAEVGAYLAGRLHELPAPLPFRPSPLSPQATPAQERHFRALLGDVDEPAAPFGVAQIDASRGDIAVVRFAVPVAAAAAVRAAARQHGVNAAALFHLAFARVVAVFSGGDDVVFGTVLTGRSHGRDGATRAVGMFLNTLPLRAPRGDVATGAALIALQQQLGELLAHEQTPLALARRCSGIGPQTPLFAAVLNYRRSAVDAGSGADGAWDGIALQASEEHSTYPLTVIVDDAGDAFGCIVKGAPGVDAACIADSLQRVLAQLAALLTQAPQRPFAALDAIAPEQRRQLLDTWNPATPARVHAPLHVCVAQHARHTPEAPALIAGDASCSYAALDARANRLAHYLRGNGIVRGDRVAVCLDRGMDLIVSLLAVFKAGAVYVPIDPAYPEQRLAFLLRDSAPSLLLTDTHNEAELPASALLRVVVIDAAATVAAIAACADDAPDIALDDDAPAYVIYTSGSTGQPKGVVNVHRGLANLAAAQRDLFALDARSRVLQFASPSFDASVFEIAMALGSGASLCLAVADALLPGAPLAQTLAREAVTHLTVPPSVLDLLTPGQLAGVSTLVVAGEALPPALAARFRSGRQLFNAYGPSEASVCASVWRCDGSETAQVPIGFPLPGTRIHILDRHGHPAPVGVVGEIHLGGAGLAAGYWQRPDLTAGRFIADPFRGGGERLYRTGDLGEYRSDGAILYRGRNDAQIKLRGFRIEPGEIEARLESCAGVRKAVVLARTDANGHRRLVAYVERADGGDIDPGGATLRRALQPVLPEHLIPAQFVRVEHWPLTSSGKLDRRALERVEAAVDVAASPPRTALEAQLVRSWANLLGLPEAQVGIDTDFFLAGGDSMLAARFVAAAALDGLQIAIRDVLDRPTVRALAPLVRTAAAASAAVPADDAGPLPLLPNVAHALAVSSADVRNCWNLFARVELPAGCSHAVLRQAFATLLQRHDALRQSYRQDAAGRWQAQILPYDGALAFRVVEAGGGDAGLAQALRAAHTAMLGGANVEGGPLIQATVLDRGAGHRAQLLWCAHHYATDAVSSEILGREFVRICEQLETGAAPALPPVVTRYRDYADYLQRYADSDACLAQLPYWRRARRHADLGIPLDRPAGKCYPWSWNDWRSSHALAALLEAAAADDAPPLPDLLVTAFAGAYARWSGRDVLWMNLVDSGRDGAPDSPDLGSTVGWIATLYPLLLEFDVPASPAQRLRSLCAQVRALPRDKSFGLLKHCHRDPAVRAELAALPEPRINFNFLGRYRSGTLDAPAPDTRFVSLPFDLSDDAYLADAGDRESTALGENYILFVCSVRDDCLDVTWAYNTEQLDQASIERFDAALAAQLREFDIAAAAAQVAA